MSLQRSPWLAEFCCACALALALACSIDDRTVMPVTAGAAGGGAGTSLGASLPQSSLPPVANGGSSAVVCDTGSACADSSMPAARPGGCVEGQRRCVDGAPEGCTGGAWLSGASCAPPLAVCLARSGQCVSCEPGAQRCTGGRVEGCGEDGVWQDLGMPCSECVPRDADCVGNTARVCSELGAWVGQTCAGAVPVCVPETGSCVCNETSCGARELCSASGRCEPLGPDCPASAPLAAADQDLGIVRVRFDPDGSAEVLMQNVGGGFLSFAALGYQLCNGANNCVFLSDTQSVTLVGADSSFSRRIPNTLPSGGELAVVFLSPDLPTTTEAYVAWGSGAAVGSFEAVANETLRRWNTGERIALEPGDTGFVCIGATNSALGYTACNP